MKKLALFFALVPAMFVAGCVGNDNLYTLDSEYLSRRQAQTRNFETKDQTEILSASAQVLQDLGFTIAESDTKLGLITATKDREAGSTAARVFTIIFGGENATYDVSQKIHANLAVAPAEVGHNVRMEMARIIWDNRGGARRERISDAKIYQEFFDKLSQSVFLTTHDI